MTRYGRRAGRDHRRERQDHRLRRSPRCRGATARTRRSTPTRCRSSTRRSSTSRAPNIDMVSGATVTSRGLHRVAAVGDRPGEPVITAEIPVTPAAPRRRGWPVAPGSSRSWGCRSASTCAPSNRPAPTSRPAWPGLRAPAQGGCRCSAPGAPTATCCSCSTGERDEAHPWVADVTELCLEAEERTDGLFRAWRRRDGGRLTYDPTGLVKGWAVAGAAAHLDVVPEISYSIGAGGDIVVGAGRGPSAAAPSWRIGIEDPRDPGAVARVVTVRRGAVATSGAAARGAARRRPPHRVGGHPLRIGDGRRPGAALGRRVGDRGVGRSGPRGAADGRPRPRLLAGHPLNPACRRDTPC